MNKLRDMDSKIVFLQETHTLKEDIKRRRRWQRDIYEASFISQARGVMTLIHKSIPFQVSDIIKNIYGRYLIIQGSLLSVNLTLVNVYGPNADELSFFTDLLLTLASLPGDWSRGLELHTGPNKTHCTKSIKIRYYPMR